jgi:NAD(P)-dependent dehydrogenase (short-subunit alcohol dehydrogenase family)
MGQLSKKIAFDGRVAIVTGGGQGLGQAHSNLLASRGATVVVNDLPDNGTDLGISERANRAAAEIVAAGGKAIAIGGDVTSREAMDSLISQTLDRFGQIDILISNAGTASYIPFHQMTLEDFDRMLRIHMHGSFLLAHAAWPHMAKRGYGRIIMTSSNGMFGLENHAHYSAAKAGVFGLMRALSLDGRTTGIAVNAIMPNAYTPLAQQVASSPTVGADTAKAIAAMASQAAGPELVSPFVAWLAHESCQVTGEVILAGMGKACRVVTAHGPGYADLEVTIEAVRDHWAEIARFDAAGEFPNNAAAIEFLTSGLIR